MENGLIRLIPYALAACMLMLAALVYMRARRRRILVAILHGFVGTAWLWSEFGNWWTPPVLFRFVIPGLLCIAAILFWPWRDPAPRWLWIGGVALDVLMVALWVAAASG